MRQPFNTCIQPEDMVEAAAEFGESATGANTYFAQNVLQNADHGVFAKDVMVNGKSCRIPYTTAGRTNSDLPREKTTCED